MYYELPDRLADRVGEADMLVTYRRASDRNPQRTVVTGRDPDQTVATWAPSADHETIRL